MALESELVNHDFLDRQRGMLAELEKARAQVVEGLTAEVRNHLRRQETGAASAEAFGTGETASAQLERVREQLSQAQARLDEVDSALIRLDAGSYGVCEMCGNFIGRDRLEAIPTAARCINCQSDIGAPRRSASGARRPGRGAVDDDDPAFGRSFKRKRHGDDDVFKAISRRRAVREYTPEPVTREEVRELLHAAVQAPSAVNAQPWAFVVVQQSKMLDRYERQAVGLLVAEPVAPEVAASGLPELDRLRRLVAAPGYRLFHGANTLVVVYATVASGVPDCFLAAQNLMLAAWAMALGTCPIGLASPLFNRSEVKRALGIPPEWVAALPVIVGHPSGETPLTARRPPHVVAWL
jgi:nitroreductase/RNA polymerase-binding transcription factor DksA